VSIGRGDGRSCRGNVRMICGSLADSPFDAVEELVDFAAPGFMVGFCSSVG